MSQNAPVCFLVVPCYNEEEVLPITSVTLKRKVSDMIKAGTIAPGSRILFCDDGSADATWKLIGDLCASDDLFAGIKLAHNRGHQNALFAGLMTARTRCDVAISLDADLQDDVEALDQFIDAYQDGCQIVFGVRSSRDTDTFFKRTSANAFYGLMKHLGANTVANHADYRLMSREALDALADYDEANLFLRGIVCDLGYKTGVVYYRRGERAAGKSKYPLGKMVHFALDGITSFSVKPLKIVTALGFIISILSIIALIYALVSKITGAAVAGWTAIVASIWLIGGIQLLSLGVVGEYVGKIYSEVKHRPRYRIEKQIV